MSSRFVMRQRRYFGFRHRLPRFLGLVGAVMVIAGFCFQPVSSAAASIVRASGPKHGGTLNVAMPGDTTGWDPSVQYMSSTFQGPNLSLVYGELMYDNPATGATSMEMAESLNPSSHDKVWTLVLHPGMKFSDGTPFNAAAVKYNIQRDANPSIGSEQEPLASTLSMNVLNATTLQINLPSVDTAFQAVFAQAFPWIGSPTAMKAEGQNFIDNPVGAGPYKLKTWTSSIESTLVKNPYYSLFAPGQPYIDNINMFTFSAAPQEEAAMQSGETQFGVVTSQGNVIVAERQAGFTVAEHIIGGGGAMMMNNSTAPFNNLLAREIIWYALNRSEIANTKAPDSGIAIGLFSKSSPYYDAKWNYPASNPAKAQQLLNQYAAQNGGPLTFSIITQNVANQEINTADIVAELSAYKNISVTTQTVTGTVETADQHTSNFQMVQYSYEYNTPIPSFTNYFASTGTLNYSKWNDPIVNAAAANAEATSSFARQVKDVDTIEQQFYEQLPDYIDSAETVAVMYKPNIVTGVHTIEYGSVPLWPELSLVHP